MSKHRVLGTRAPRIDAAAKATGRAVYTDDIALPGMLHGAILQSPVAHARIQSIDVSKAQALPGVEAVLTAAENDTVHSGWIFDDRFVVENGEAGRILEEPAAFRAQNVFAVAARTLALFERVLGRRVQWRHHRSRQNRSRHSRL